MSKLHDEITSEILAELENGVAPWVRPWGSDGTASLPYNAVSGKTYNGINTVLLSMCGAANGFASNGWMTFKQMAELKGTVEKGSKMRKIVYLGQAKRENEKGEEEGFSFLKSYFVFNVSQISGLPEKYYPQPSTLSTFEQNEKAADFIDATGAEIRHGGGRAFYSPAQDFINVPYGQDFKSPSDYYSTVLHELTHWTGHKSRCDRDLSKGRFGNADYAFEELVAELGSAFVCAELGITGKLQHAEYIGSWVKVLKEHSTAIFKAAGMASKASAYLKGLQGAKVSQPVVMGGVEVAAQHMAA